jgi:Plasmid stabilization system protein
MKIKFLIAAEEHLDNIYNHIAEKSERAAITLYNHFLDEIERLENFSQIAAIEPLLINKPQTFRSLVVHRNYKVIYYIEKETIYIAAIWDCRQSPEINEKKIK